MRWGWLLTAVALLGYLLARRRKLSRLVLAAGGVATVVAALIGFGVIELPNIEHLLVDVGTALGRWTYLVVGVLAFLETGAFVGLIAPGETTVLVGGLVAGQGQISLLVLIAIVWTCAVAGDVTSYTLGRKLGRDWMVRHGPRVKITEERLRQVEQFFQRRGGITILIGRFIGLVRALAPFIAGTTKMPLRVFLPYDVVGAGAWATTFCVLGYVFWRSFDRLTEYVSRGLFAFGTVVAVGVALYYLVRLRRDAELRDKLRTWLEGHEDKPFVRPLIRAARPVWRRVLSPAAGGVHWTARFGQRRLTPGNLGLELTTLLALGAVAAFTFVLLGEVQAEPGEPRIDELSRDISDELTMDMLTDVVSVVTDLGSWPVTAAAVFATAIWATLMRRYIEALALVTGHALTWAAVHAAKDHYDRVRPDGGLVDVSLSAYPSGHAAYAVAYIACATVLVRAGVGWALRFAVVTVAVIAAAIVAGTRVYLRVHFLTDVLGGIGLAVAIWAVVGILALFAGRVRQNDAPST